MQFNFISTGETSKKAKKQGVIDLRQWVIKLPCVEPLPFHKVVEANKAVPSPVPSSDLRGQFKTVNGAKWHMFFSKFNHKKGKVLKFVQYSTYSYTYSYI